MSLQNKWSAAHVRLTFKDGKVIEAIANDMEPINKVLDTDEGARCLRVCNWC